MFCGGAGHCKPYHWCALCKFSGCPACCGCTQCVREKHGHYSPEGAPVSHGGFPVSHDWADIP